MADAPIVTATVRNLANKVGVQSGQPVGLTDVSDVQNVVPVVRHRVALTKTAHRRRVLR